MDSAPSLFDRSTLLEQLECKICHALNEKVTLSCCNTTICTACIAKLTPKKRPKNKPVDIKCPYGCPKCVVPPEGLPVARELNDLLRFVLYHDKNGKAGTDGCTAGENQQSEKDGFGDRKSPDKSVTNSNKSACTAEDASSSTRSAVQRIDQQKSNEAAKMSDRLYGGSGSAEFSDDSDDDDNGGDDDDDSVGEESTSSDEPYVEDDDEAKNSLKRKRSPTQSRGQSAEKPKPNPVSRGSVSVPSHLASDSDDDALVAAIGAKRIKYGGSAGASRGQLQAWSSAARSFDGDEFHTVHSTNTRSTKTDEKEKKPRLLRELEDYAPKACDEKEDEEDKLKPSEIERMKVWEEHYFQLVHYGDVHNTYLVPKDYTVTTEEGKVLKLGAWTARQRSRMKGGCLSAEKMEYIADLICTGRTWYPPSRGEQLRIKQEEKQEARAKAKALKDRNPSSGRMVQPTRKFLSISSRRSRPDGLTSDNDDGDDDNDDGDDDNGDYAAAAAGGGDRFDSESDSDYDSDEDDRKKGPAGKGARGASPTVGLSVENELLSGLNKRKSPQQLQRSSSSSASSPPALVPGNLKRGTYILYRYEDQEGVPRIRFGKVIHDVEPDKARPFLHAQVFTSWVVPKKEENLPNSPYRLVRDTVYETTVENILLSELQFGKDKINMKHRSLTNRSKRQLAEFLENHPQLTHEKIMRP